VVVCNISLIGERERKRERERERERESCFWETLAAGGVFIFGRTPLGQAEHKQCPTVGLQPAVCMFPFKRLPKEYVMIFSNRRFEKIITYSFVA